MGNRESGSKARHNGPKIRCAKSNSEGPEVLNIGNTNDCSNNRADGVSCSSSARSQRRRKSAIGINERPRVNSVSSTGKHSVSLSYGISPCQAQVNLRRFSLVNVRLQPTQKLLLRDSWRRISKIGRSHSLGSIAFQAGLDRLPVLKQAMQQASVIEGVFGFGFSTPGEQRCVPDHGKLLWTLLDDSIRNLDDLEGKVSSQCFAMGVSHASYHKYGLKPDHWDIFGEAIIETIQNIDHGTRGSMKRMQAWNVLVCFIVDCLREGYQNALRHHESRQQTPVLQAPQALSPVPERSVEYSPPSSNTLTDTEPSLDHATNYIHQRYEEDAVRDVSQLAVDPRLTPEMRARRNDDYEDLKRPQSVRDQVDKSKNPFRRLSYHGQEARRCWSGTRQLTTAGLFDSTITEWSSGEGPTGHRLAENRE